MADVGQPHDFCLGQPRRPLIKFLNLERRVFFAPDYQHRKNLQSVCALPLLLQPVSRSEHLSRYGPRGETAASRERVSVMRVRCLRDLSVTEKPWHYEASGHVEPRVEQLPNAPAEQPQRSCETPVCQPPQESIGDHKTAETLRMVKDSWQTDRPADVMYYERNIVQVKLVDEIAEIRGVIRKRVRPVLRLVRQTEADVIGCYHPVGRRETADDIAVKERPNGCAVDEQHRAAASLVHIVHSAAIDSEIVRSKRVLGSVQPGRGAGSIGGHVIFPETRVAEILALREETEAENGG